MPPHRTGFRRVGKAKAHVAHVLAKARTLVGDVWSNLEQTSLLIMQDIFWEVDHSPSVSHTGCPLLHLSE